MMINLKDNSEKDKYILELFQTSPKEAFRLLFDAYHMKLCIYAVQLTDSFEMAEDLPRSRPKKTTARRPGDYGARAPGLRD